MPNLQALATNKLQASLGTLSASITMIATGHVDLRRIWKDVAACFAGAVLGTALVRMARPAFLDVAIPVAVAATCVFFLLRRNAGRARTAPRVSRAVWRGLGLPVIGLYDGYFGPGAGMFYQAGQVAMRGLTTVAATANAKPLNLASNTAALALFVAGGDVVWSIGLAMMAGQAIGGYLGARAVISRGHRFIRATIVVMCLAMLAKFGWDAVVAQGTQSPGSRASLAWPPGEAVVRSDVARRANETGDGGCGWVEVARRPRTGPAVGKRQRPSGRVTGVRPRAPTQKMTDLRTERNHVLLGIR